MAIKFGTDGWRAVISEDFTFENVRKVAQAIADVTNDQFKDAVRRLLFKKPNPDAVSEDYEPTQEELEEVYKVESEQD